MLSVSQDNQEMMHFLLLHPHTSNDPLATEYSNFSERIMLSAAIAENAQPGVSICLEEYVGFCSNRRIF